MKSKILFSKKTVNTFFSPGQGHGPGPMDQVRTRAQAGPSSGLGRAGDFQVRGREGQRVSEERLGLQNYTLTFSVHPASYEPLLTLLT